MKINNKLHFLLFTNCILVKGYKVSIIMDLQRNGFLPIPNLLFEVLNLDLRVHSIGEIKKEFKGEINEGIDCYLEFLVKEEYGFFTKEPFSFPDIKKDFFSPFPIVTSVINYSSKSPFSLENIFVQLNNLGCQLIQIRIFDRISLNLIEQHISIIKKSRINLLELYIPDCDYDTNEILKIVESDFKIRVILYASNKAEDFIKKFNNKSVFFISENISPYSKEKIDMRLFVSDLEFYFESVKHNVGLNRKVSIDIDGSVKNFVNHLTVYGNVMTNTIESIIDRDEFKQQWYICNDMIEKCKVCQYRYMCLSNSFVESKNKKFYKVDACRFDPITNTWNSK